MKVALVTVLRNDMLECYQYVKELGIEVDVFVRPNTPQWKLDNITRNNLSIIYYQNEDDLVQKMGNYDITCTYEFYGKTAVRLMKKYNNYIAEIAWNRPNYGTGWYFDNWWQEQCLALAKKRVRKFVARSQSVVDCLIQEGIDPQKIKLIPGVCDTDRFKPRPKPDQYKDNLVFLFIGRVSEQKGVFEIFHSFVRANIPNSILLYRGPPHPTNPWEVKVIEKWTKLLKLEDKVFILPQIEQQDIHSYYNWGDIFITLPNTDLKFMEQIGFTLPQAMASGLPIITCDYGGQSEFVTPQCGIKIPHRDYVAGARAMQAMADETLRKGMACVSRSRAVEYYSTEVFAREIKKVYEEVLS